MKDLMSRRQALAQVVGVGGVVAGVALWGAKSVAEGGPAVSSPEWVYRELDPEEGALIAYTDYKNGGCGNAMIMGIVGQLAKKYGAPYDQFPYQMMRYAAGGITGQGSICGSLNVAAAAMGLFFAGDKLSGIVSGLFSWYETTELPVYVPPASVKPSTASPIPKSRSDSVLCHISVSRWCDIAKVQPNSPEKHERCVRLTSDVCRKAIELMNAELKSQKIAALPSSSAQCLSCHGQGKTAKMVNTKMSCTPCHTTLPKGHP